MRRLLSAALLGALTVGIPMTATSTASAAPGCIKTSDTRTWGRGEISACFEGGVARIQGNVVDLLPGGGLGGADGYCVAWYIEYETTSGVAYQHSPLACGHLGRVERTFDYDPSAGEYGVKGITGVKRVVLNNVSI
ncbi:hypothetical protein [Streptomyces regalis]|uniref:Secreted protein n=1 Tax=Streptomyces regalis TaxID=68262 RepID=A0A124G729_9ACTN|nr:hypothetical protein [Streptomyces regalis]KUL21460.1 hypothetical protein ADL12_44790 [Streptomyces regalis]